MSQEKLAHAAETFDYELAKAGTSSDQAHNDKLLVDQVITVGAAPERDRLRHA